MYYLQTKASFDAAHFYGNTKENVKISTDIVGMLLQKSKVRSWSKKDRHGEW